MIKILGVGSPFGDDQIGWYIIDELAKKIPNFDLRKCDRPGINLVYLMAGASKIFLIDAVKSFSMLGTIHRLEDEKIEGSRRLFSSHGFGIAQSLALARALKQIPEKIIFYGVEIIDTTTSHLLSEDTKAAGQKLIEQLMKEL